jgi:hypothetical protein
MDTLNNFVTVAFWINLSGMAVCGVNFFSTVTQQRIIVHLTDADHQSLVDTLDHVWPNWVDADQDLARSA